MLGIDTSETVWGTKDPRRLENVTDSKELGNLIIKKQLYINKKKMWQVTKICKMCKG